MVILVILYFLLVKITLWSMAVMTAVLLPRMGSRRWALVIAFVIGIVQDIVSITPLGAHAALLITLVTVVWLLTGQFRSWSWGVMVGASVLGEMIHLQLIGRLIGWSLVWQALVVGLVVWLIDRWVPRDSIYVD